MRSQTCCFTGHRKIPISEKNSIKQQLRSVIVNLIKNGIIYYGCGGALGFDTLAAQVVLELKNIYPNIKLIMVCPCKEQDKFWSEQDKERYKYILKHSDKVVYVSDTYTKECMMKRNRHLVDNSGYCICYLKKSTGGTAYTIEYAQKNKLNIINIE